jgi:selenide,water dikinase
MGGEPQSALAIATLPYGLEAKVEDTLTQLLTGATEVLNAAQTALVGGHTSEGAELSLGFAINGLADPQKVLRKGGMRPGDSLILTKPIGTGTLFAADMRLKAKGRWISGAVASMLQSNQEGAECLRRHGVTACTDVTGFGVLGHIVEMAQPSEVDVELYLNAIAVLEGAEETVAAGIFSSLQPQNLRLRRAIRDVDSASRHSRYPLIYDPQTAGGLLASVPADRAERCLEEMKGLGYERAAIVGRVVEKSEHPEAIRLVV